MKKAKIFYFFLKDEQQTSSIPCSLMSSSHRRAIVLLSSMEDIAASPLLRLETEFYVPTRTLTLYSLQNSPSVGAQPVVPLRR